MDLLRFLNFLKFLDFFGFFLDFFFGFLLKLIMLLLKVTKVTTEHQQLPKMGQNSIITSFCAQRAKKPSAEGRSPPQELEIGPHSGPYLLVEIKAENTSSLNKLKVAGQERFQVFFVMLS